MFSIKFSVCVFGKSVSITIKTKRYERAVELAQTTPAARVYKGQVPTNLHTLRHYVQK